MSSYFSFGVLSIQNLYPFICSFFYVIRSYCLYEMKNPKNNFSFHPDHYLIFFTFIMFTGELFNGFFYLASLLLQRKDQQKIDTEKITFNRYIPSKIDLIQNKSSLSMTLTLFIIFIAAFLDGLTYTVANIVIIFYDTTDYLSFEMRAISLLSLAILSYLLLSYSIFKHEIVSCGIVGIGFIFFFIADTKGELDYINVVIYSGNYFLFALKDVIEKWVMKTRHINAVQIVFIEGLFGITIMFTILLIIYFIGENLDGNILHAFKDIYSSLLCSLYFIIYLTGCIFYNFFSIHTKDFFKPTLLGICDAFSFVLWIIMVSIINTESPKWLTIVGDVFILFGSLLFNEIIIINYCGMEVYTKKEIIKRSDQEKNIAQSELYD